MKHHSLRHRLAHPRLLLAALSTALPSGAAERTWDGGAVVGFDWSNSNNWDPNTVPSNGDSLLYPGDSLFFAADHISHNDLPAGRWYRSIKIFSEPGAFSSEGYELTGNAIELRPDPTGNAQLPTALFVQNGTDNLSLEPIITFFNLDVTLGADCAFVQSGRVDLQGNVNLAGHVLRFGQNSVAGHWDCTGGFSGNGELIVDGTMKLRNNASFTGQITVAGGPVYVTQPESLGSTAARTVIYSNIHQHMQNTTDAVESNDYGLFLQIPSVSEPFTGKLGRIVADAGTAQTLTGDFTTEFTTGSYNTGAGFETIPTFAILEARNNSMALTGPLHGNGRIHISGPHPVRIGGTAPNAQTALVKVGSTGVLELDKQGGPAVSGPVSVQDGGVLRTLRSGQIGGLQTVDLGRGSLFELNGATTSMKSLHLDGAKVMGGGVLEVQDYVMANSAITGGQGYGCEINAALRITGTTPEFFIRNNFGSVIGAGAISVAPGSPVTTLRLIEGVDSDYGLGPGNLFWTGNITGLQLVRVESGRFHYSGLATGVDVTLAGGSFTGAGATLRDLTDIGGGEVLADGGSVSVRNLTLHNLGTFIRDVSTSTVNDAIVASGSVQLAGSALKLKSLLSPSSAIGTRRILIQKNSAGPVAGVFRYPPDINAGAVIPEGGIVNDENHQWRLSYSDLDGNDVTITLVGILPTGDTRQWTGGGPGSSWSFNDNWSNPPPKPGDTLRFPAVTDRLTTNNFAAGIIYNNILVTADAYRFAGNPLALMSGINANYPSGNADFEQAVVLGANQTFFARQSARLRLSLTNNGGVDLNGFALTLNAVNNGSVIDVGNAAAGSDPASALTGTGSVSKAGPGIVNFNAPTDFIGPLTVSFGTARVTRSGAALGSSAANSGTSVSGVSSRLELLLAGTIPEPLHLQGGTLHVNPGAAQTLTGTGALSSSGGIIEVTQGQYDVAAALSGNSARKTGAGTLRLAPASVPSLSGGFTVDGGLVILGSSGSPNMAAPVTLNNAGTVLRLDAANQLGGPVTLNPGTTLNLNGQSDTIPALTLTDSAITTGAGTLTSPLVSTSGLAGSTISGKFAIPAGGTLFNVLNDDPATDLTVSAAVSGSTLTLTGGGGVVFSGANTFTAAQINDGIAIFNGTNSAAVTLNGGMAGGSGSVGAITSGAAGGFLAPGASTGILSSGSVTLNAATTFFAEINTATPGTGHDQLNVTGAVNLGGAALQVLPLTPSPAGTFVIINNDGTDAVSGTFAGLPENSLIAAGGRSFRISYIGGTGNDVTLAVVVTGTGVTKTWSGLGSNNQWTTAGNWLGGVAPVAGDDLVFPAGVSVKTCNNTFPAGTVFNSLRIADSGYGLAGNGISLNAGAVFDYPTGLSSVALDVTLANTQSFTVLQGAQINIVPSAALATAGFTLTAHVDAAAGRITLNNLSGAGALIKTGIGGLTMNANNWNGPVTLSGGETKTGTLLGFGAGTSAIVVQNGAELRFENIAAGTFSRPLTLAGKLEISASPVTLSGAIALASGGLRTVETDGAGIPLLSGVISGSGGLRKAGAGSLTLAGGSANTFTGGCTVAGGTLRLQKANQVALPGPVTIGDGSGADVLTFLAANQISNAATVNLNGSGAQMQCGAFNDTIGALRFTGGSVTGSTGTLTVGERLESFAAATTATVDVNFVPLASPFSITVADGAAAVDLAMSSDWLGDPALDASRDGAGTFQLRSGTMRALSLLEGVTLVTGLFNASDIQLQGGTLGGDGITTNVSTVSGKGGTISPGASPAELTVANWTGDADTALNIEIGGIAPGTQYDVLNVTGIANPHDAVLNLTAIPGFSPQQGQSFTILKNGGPDPIPGEFFKLSEGEEFSFAGATAGISYKGGDGNDVTVTILRINSTGITRVWDGGSSTDSNWTTPANWADDEAPQPGDALIFPAGASRLTNTNNFPAGTNFDRISMAGNNYVLTGNAILLNAGLSANAASLTCNFGIPVTLTGPQTFSTEGMGDFVLAPSATVALNGHTLTFAINSNGDLKMQGSVTGAGSVRCESIFQAGGTGGGKLQFSGASGFSGLFTLVQGDVIISQPSQAGTSMSISATAQLFAETAPNAIFSQPISLRGAVNVPDSARFNGAITLPTGANGIFSGDAVTLAGRIQGSGALSAFVFNQLTITGTLNNTFTGGFTLLSGEAILQKPNNITALPGPVFSHGTIRCAADHQIADTASVTVEFGALDTAGFSDTIGALTIEESVISTGAGSLTLAGPFTATGGSMSGSIVLAGTAPVDWTIHDLPAPVDFTCAAAVTAPGGAVLRKTGAGTIQFSGTGGSAAIHAAEGTLLWNGTSSLTDIFLAGGTIGGTGACRDIQHTAAGGIVAPGASPGVLRADGSAAFNAATTLRIEINGTGTGTQHDQFACTNTLDLGDAALDLQLNYIPSNGDVLTIVDATAGGLNGHFAGLPEGMHFSEGGFTFRINYLNGDVILTVTDVPDPDISAFSLEQGAGGEAGQTVVNVTAAGLQGLPYLLESSADMENWTLLQTAIAQPDGTITFRALQPDSTQRSFYRSRR